MCLYRVLLTRVNFTWGMIYRFAPHQMAAIRLQGAAILAELQVVVASHLTRRDNAILRLRHAQQLRLDPIYPTASCVRTTLVCVPN